MISRLSSGIDTLRRRWSAMPWAGRAGVLLAAGLWAYAVWGAEPYRAGWWSSGLDSHPYWAASIASPYALSTEGTVDAYLYSPAFLQIMTPLRALPWILFTAAWTGVLLAALWAVTGTGRFFWALLLFGWWETNTGNISFILAWVALAGFSRPGLWAIPALTKVTPVLGAAWFALRGEWRALAALALVVAGVVGASVLLGGVAPWREWLGVLAANTAVSPSAALALPVPALIRWPTAAGLLVYAARTDRRWLMPAVVTLALPIVWWGGLSILLATPAMYAADQRRRSDAMRAGADA